MPELGRRASVHARGDRSVASTSYRSLSVQRRERAAQPSSSKLELSDGVAVHISQALDGHGQQERHLLPPRDELMLCLIKVANQLQADYIIFFVNKSYNYRLCSKFNRSCTCRVTRNNTVYLEVVLPLQYKTYESIK